MAGNVLGTLFQDIANAIRSKIGGGTMTPNDFPDKILSIVTGGSINGEDDTSVRATSGWIYTNQSGIYRQTIHHGLGTMPDMIIVSNGNWLGLTDVQRDANPLMFMWGAHSKFKDAFAGTLAGAGCAKQGITLDTGNDKGIDEYQPDSFLISCPDDDTFEFGVPESDYKGNYGLVAPDPESTYGYYKWIAITGMGGTVSGGGSGGSAEGCVTVTFMNGDEVLFTRPVYIGDDCPDPYVQNRIELPTKESTAQYTYTFKGWSTVKDGTADGNALKTITADKTLYAAYSSAVRKYTVNFYDGDTLLKTEQVAYGGSSSYEYRKSGMVFNGWTPTPTNVSADMDCYGEWVDAEVVVEEITDSWDEIIAAINDGSYKTKYKLGNYKVIDGVYYTSQSYLQTDANKVVMQIVAKDADELADGSGKAAITWLSMGIFSHSSVGYNWNTQSSQSTKVDGVLVYTEGTGTIGGWEKSVLRQGVKGFKSLLPSNIQAAIKTVSKSTMITNTSAKGDCVTTDEDVWLPSVREMFADKGYTDVSQGVTLDNTFQENRGVTYSVMFCDDDSRKTAAAPGTTTKKYWLRSANGYSTASLTTQVTYTNWSRIGFCT